MVYTMRQWTRELRDIVSLVVDKFSQEEQPLMYIAQGDVSYHPEVAPVHWLPILGDCGLVRDFKILVPKILWASSKKAAAKVGINNTR